MPFEKFENGTERYIFCNAVEDAFPDITKLKQVVSFGLDENLNVISGHYNLRDTVFNLVQWAESNGKLPQLIESLCNQEYGNPGNPQLRLFCQECSLSKPAPKPPIQQQTQPAPTIPPQIEENDLASEKGVDYKRLWELLKAGKWKEADQETLIVMLKLADKEKKDWLDYESIDNFPCTDLRTIDQLWVKYSNGRFGFSVQKRIWESVGKDYEKFGDRVGWRKVQERKKEEGWLWWKKEKIELYYKWLLYNDINFSILAPDEGHLPTIAFGVRYSVFSRVQTCQV